MSLLPAEFAAGTTARGVLVLAVLSASAAGGAWVMAQVKDAEIAEIKRSAANRETQAASDALERLTDASVRGDQLAGQIARLETDLQTLTEEKNRAIVKSTSGRPCLDLPAVRVLNGAVGQPAALSVPEAAGQPAAADAGFASDTDIALWIAGAQRAYKTCQGRLGAIADYYASAPDEESAE